METYLVEPRKHKRSIKQLGITILYFASVYFVIALTQNLLWPPSNNFQKSLYWVALKVAFISLFWGIAMTFAPNQYPTCKLFVDDESITSVAEYGGWMKWYKRRKTVSAGNVRFIREINGKSRTPKGLLASEQTRLGAWMWGGIYIPATLPEYERLKSLVESWRAPDFSN